MKCMSSFTVAGLSLVLAACVAGTNIPAQAETFVAGASTPTTLPMESTSPPGVVTVPADGSMAEKLYQSSALGIQFSYPEHWYLQEVPSNDPPEVVVASFDPANPPHKLERTNQTVSLRFGFKVFVTPPESFESWVESARQAALANQLTIFGEERLAIANGPAARLTLVSGSGGILDQVLTILNGRYYDISIEGNFDLARGVLDTVQPLGAAGLKPPDSDTPAAGICGESQGDPVSIVLGMGSDGLPNAGRCLILHPAQRIRLINQSAGAFNIKFAEYIINLPPGNEIVLDKPVAEYLAPGVHFLPMGPELWVQPPGVRIYGHVALQDGSSIADARIYLSLAAYPGELIATTDGNGDFQSGIKLIPGDENVTIWVELEGYSFSPSTVSWRHYHGFEEPTLNFTGNHSGLPTITPDPIPTMPGPLRNYSNAEAGFSLTLPPSWNVDEVGRESQNKEVVFYPGNAEAFVTYLSISLDSRTLQQIMDLYAQTTPDAVREDTVFNGYPGIKYTYTWGRVEYFIPFNGRIYLIITDRPDDGNVQQMLMSIRFTPITVTRYINHELRYSLVVPQDWIVDENGMSGTNREVRIYPPGAVPFIAYLDIGLDPRSLDDLKAQDVPEAQKFDIFFAGQNGVEYMYTSGRIEMYLLYNGQVYYLLSDKPADDTIGKMIGSFSFSP